MNENTLKAALVIVLILAGGGITGAFLIMNESQTRYAALQSDFQTLTEDFTDLFNDCGNLTDDYAGLTTDHEDLLETYGDLTESYGILTGEFDSLNQSYYALLEDYNTLSANYAELLTEYDQLNTTYYSLLDDYNALSASYDELLTEYDQLNTTYYILLDDYNALNTQYLDLWDDHNELSNDYIRLLLQYNTMTTWVRQQILPAQYMVFAEAVRRYYFEDFYVQDKFAEGNISGYWAEFTRFCRDVILHDSQTGDFSLAGSWFPDVSNALADCLRYGNQTEYLAFQNFYWTFYDWLPNWAWAPYTDDLASIAELTQWCIDNIDYEYDSDITMNQEPYDWDYIKFPVETAFRTLGDCEDQAMLTAAYLESCGFETAMAVFHDDDHPTLGEFYHGVLRVHVEDPTEFKLRYPLCSLWRMAESIDPYWPDYTWCWVDPTWDVPFGTDPSWLLPYILTGISYTDMTVAICDLNGAVSYVGVGTGLEASMP